MEKEEIKRKLMGLWERTTHNSKETISILFDFYYDEKYLEFKEVDGKIISALIGIPYTFGYGEKGLRGLYLISLSTEEGYHKKGDLSDQLEIINKKVKGEFDFTFLVPNTELLADYFGSKGYFSSFFILEERFTPLHDFKNDYLLSLNDSDERIRDLKKNLLNEIKTVTYDKEKGAYKEKIKDFIVGRERKGSQTVNLKHRQEDLEYLLANDSIRNLSVHLSLDSDDKITGIMFAHKEEVKRIKVVAAFVLDNCSYYAILDHIHRENPDYSISVITSEPKYQTYSLVEQTYAASNPEGGDLDNTFGVVEIPFNINKLLQPLGMVKLLRIDRIIEYISNTRSDVNFKLHVRDFDNFDNERMQKKESDVFVVKNGKMQIEPLESYKHDRGVLNLSVKEVSELLLRKKDTSNLIMEAFGIPRLDLQISLLPC